MSKSLPILTVSSSSYTKRLNLQSAPAVRMSRAPAREGVPAQRRTPLECEGTRDIRCAALAQTHLSDHSSMLKASPPAVLPRTGPLAESASRTNEVTSTLVYCCRAMRQPASRTSSMEAMQVLRSRVAA